MNRTTSTNIVTAAVVQQMCPRGGRVLDVGCGSKPYKRLIEHDEWVGLDIRPVGELTGDMCADGFPEGFDLVICTDALHMADDPFVAVHNMADALNKGGHLFITTRNCGVDDGEAYFDIKARGIGRLFESAGITPINISTASKQWEHEFQNWLSAEKYGVVASDVDGFTGYLEDAFPQLTVALGRKE